MDTVYANLFFCVIAVCYLGRDMGAPRYERLGYCSVCGVWISYMALGGIERGFIMGLAFVSLMGLLVVFIGSLKRRSLLYLLPFSLLIAMTLS